VMNLVQAGVAHAVAAHFKRYDKTMHRDGPVSKINEDQNMLVDDLVKQFSYQNNLFNEKAFRDIISS
jgi:hypothetical protein